MSLPTISLTSQRMLFERYLGEVFGSLAEPQRGLLLEARTRLEQLDHSLACCRAAAERQGETWRSERQSWEARLPLAHTPSGSEPTDRQRALRQAAFEARYHAEAFYYFGARFQRILKSLNGLGPNFDFTPVLGIVKVRNDLIEHPEGRNSQVFFGGTQAATEPFNIWLKVPQNLSGMNGPLDPGLIENVEALRQELDRCFGEALRKRPSLD
jgi:hypothetical protein